MGKQQNLPNLHQKVYLNRLPILIACLGTLNWGCATKTYADGVELASTEITPQIIQLDLPAKDNGVGGLITADVNDDGTQDFIITKPGQIAVYDGSGNQLWTKQVNIQVSEQAEKNGLPGWHGPGVQAGDVDGDGKTEILFLTKDKTLEVVSGVNGETKASVTLASPSGTERWEHLVVSNFRGQGDRDLLLQTTNSTGYRLGRYLAAYALDDLLKDPNAQPLWTKDNFHGPAHSGARVADLDGDGKDEVLGGTLLGPDGKVLVELPMPHDQNYPHLDSIFVLDVRPEIPGIEVVALEEAGENRVFLYNRDRVLWETHHKNQEPQNAAVGEFDPDRPGLEVWSRSRYNEDQKPFVFDAQGQLIAEYEMKNVAPQGWTVRGVEVIFPIYWTGEPKQLVAAKERHKSGDVALFDPVTGEFLYRITEKADRLYVADVTGDWREELIVLNGSELRIYSNPEANPNPNRARLWEDNYYRRSKMTWNYYNP